MSGLAIPSPERAAATPQPSKRERISPKIAKAVNLLLTGECTTQKAAAERIGTSAAYLCTQLRKPAVEAFIARRSRETIAQGQMRASARLIQLIDASSEHVSLDATKHTLAIGGIRPPDQGQVNVNVGVSVGYVIDLSGSAPQQSVTTIDARVTHDDE
jgi:hypothetical protein